MTSPIEPRTESKPLEGILQVLRQQMPFLSKIYKVKSLGVFGSYVRGEQHEGSDLDLLVEFERAPGLFKFIELEDYLQEVLGVKVDLVMKSALKPRLGENILAEAVAV